ncbi:MAG TPA: fluoride efflux transporter CrcB [Victivallales bacterium]|nr:fluoride efflux transporter CrcB [Victivallales bacterium]
MLQQCLFVGIGGFFGAISRYLISTKVQVISKSTVFPYGTLAVNFLGCLIIGFLSGIVLSSNWLSLSMQNLLITGFLGALTTFSTFGFETYTLIRNRAVKLAVVNIFLQLVVGISLLYFGFYVACILF